MSCTLIPRHASFVWIGSCSDEEADIAALATCQIIMREINLNYVFIRSVCVCAIIVVYSFIYSKNIEFNKIIKMHQTNIQYRYFNLCLGIPPAHTHTYMSLACSV